MRFLIAMLLLSVGTHAQWIGYKVTGVPASQTASRT